ncbi:cutinase family protein [Nocardia asteroides]|uniref:cutinase family protein n=1 Tax=Nocardia asteroides TaxID=1824 RepID=UPI0037C71703
MAVGIIAGGAGGVPSTQAGELPMPPVCPAMYALGVHGTGETSPDAAMDTDSGMLSMVFRPMLAAAPDQAVIARAYLAYDAGFGGAVGSSRTPYSESVARGVLRLNGLLAQLQQRCPRTRLALVGYSQGAHVVSLAAQTIGAGAGPFAPQMVSAVVLFADPTRSVNAPLFPGAPDATTPAPAPGTATEHLSRVPHPPVPGAASGGGIGPSRDIAADFGTLTGRVASLCIPGDLACDTPEHSAILRAVAGIAGQSSLSTGDPIASLTSIAQALAYTSIKTVTAVAAQDIQGESVTELKYVPGKSISARLADASDPRTPVDTNAAVAGLARMGTLGLAAVSAVAQKLLNPATPLALAQAALMNPFAAIEQLRQDVAGAITHLTPPVTGDDLVNDAFSIVQREIEDNADLFDLATLVRYSDTTRHDGYTRSSGNTPSLTSWAAGWLAASAWDAARSPTLAPAAPPAARGQGSSTTASPNPPPADSRGPVQRSTDPGTPTATPTGPSPVGVVGVPPQHPEPADTPVDTSTAEPPPGPRQPGISTPTTGAEVSSVARQPGITPENP